MKMMRDDEPRKRIHKLTCMKKLDRKVFQRKTGKEKRQLNSRLQVADFDNLAKCSLSQGCDNFVPSLDDISNSIDQVAVIIILSRRSSGLVGL